MLLPVLPGAHATPTYSYSVQVDNARSCTSCTSYTLLPGIIFRYLGAPHWIVESQQLALRRQHEISTIDICINTIIIVADNNQPDPDCTCILRITYTYVQSTEPSRYYFNSTSRAILLVSELLYLNCLLLLSPHSSYWSDKIYGDVFVRNTSRSFIPVRIAHRFIATGTWYHHTYQVCIYITQTTLFTTINTNIAVRTCIRVLYQVPGIRLQGNYFSSTAIGARCWDTSIWCPGSMSSFFRSWFNSIVV